MKLYNNIEEYQAKKSELRIKEDIQVDNYGQVIIYTGVYHWKNGSIHDEPEELNLSSLEDNYN